MILLNEDIVERYAAKRKNLPKDEVEDLLKCIVKFLKKDIREENEYAYHIPSLGVLHTKLKTELEMTTLLTENKRINQMFLEVMFSPNNNLLKKKDETLGNFKIEV